MEALSGLSLDWSWMAAASDSLVIPEDAFLPPNESKRE
jgi:hypothetical protein